MADLALVGQCTAQGKGYCAKPVNPLAGIVGMGLSGYAVSAPPVAALVGHAVMMAKGRAATTKRGALVGRMTAQAKAYAFPHGIAPVIDFPLETIMRSTAVPARGAMTADDVVCQGSFVE